MKKTWFSLFVVLVAIFMISACGELPTAPSGGYNPDRSVTPDNRPDGPGPSFKATADYAVYGYDCSVLPESCDPSQKLEPTDDPALKVTDRVIYVVKLSGSHTLAVCTDHPGVPGRQISMLASASARGGFTPSIFDEGDMTKRGTEIPGSNPKRYKKCIAQAAFNSSGSDNFGSMKFHESGQDLIDWSEETEIRVSFAFLPR